MKNIPWLRFFDRPRVLLLLCGVVVYANTLINDFSADDNMLFLRNTFYHSASNIPRIFDKSYNSSGQVLIYGSAPDKGSGSVAYRPVLTLSYFFDYAHSKLNPFGYHLTNLFLHLINILLAYQLVLKFFDPRLAFFSAILFCLHPIQSEAVCAIGYRGDLLMAFFVLIAATSWMAFREGRRWALGMCLGAYFLGLFTKETAILFPLWVFFVDMFSQRKVIGADKRSYLWFLVIAAFYLWVYFFVFPNTTLSQAVTNIRGTQDYITVLAQIWAVYIKYFLIPFVAISIPGLYHPLPVPLVSWVFILSAAVVVLAAGGLIREVLRRSRWSVAALWFLVFFLPASGLIPNPNLAALRYLYLPGLGIYILIAAGLIWVYERPWVAKIPDGVRKFVVIALILDCAIMTFQCNGVWLHNARTYTFWAERYPDFYMGHMGIGQHYYVSGMYQEAAMSFERARKDPRCENATVSYYLGMSYLRMGLEGKAKGIFEDMIRQYPFYSGGYGGLGVFYLENRNYKKSKEYYERMLFIDGTFHDFANLLRACYALGDMSGLDKVFTRAKELWGEDSELFRRLVEFTRPLLERKTIIFYRNHMLSLSPFTLRMPPMDLRYRSVPDPMIML